MRVAGKTTIWKKSQINLSRSSRGGENPVSGRGICNIFEASQRSAIRSKLAASVRQSRPAIDGQQSDWLSG